MAIPRSGLFDYVAEFTSASFRSDEIVLQARSRIESGEPVLLGHVPKVRFWKDRVVILAADSRLARMKWMSFPVGDVVFLVARPGDLLTMIRSQTGDLGLAIIRDNQLVVALGAVAGMTLGHAVVVRNSFEGLQVCIDEHVSTLSSRESVHAMGGSARYDVYVERTFQEGFPGIAECVSIIRAGETKSSNAAMRGAVLLANENRDTTLKGELWDGRYLRA
jgi:hypothetical protein